MPDHLSRRSLVLLLALVASGCANEPVKPSSLQPQVLQPSCDAPAPLEGTYDSRAPGYIIVLRDSVAVQAEVTRLAALYQFTPRAVYEHALHGFAADLTPEGVAGLRCELTISRVSYDGVFSVAGRRGALPH